MQKYIIIYSLFLQSLFSQTGWYWQNPQPSGENLRSVCFVNDETGYIVGNGGFIQKSTNAGLNWVKQTSSSAENLECIYFTNLTTGFICGKNSVLLKTTNGGVNWDHIYMQGYWTLLSIHFYNENTGFCCGSEVILKTTNAGINWTLKYNESSTFESIYMLSPDSIIAVGYKSSPNYLSYIYKSTNSGLNWIVSNSPVSRPRYIYFLNNHTGYLAGNGGIAITSNTGSNWNYINYPGQYHFIKFKDPNTGFFAGMDEYYNGAIIYTSNSGVNWIEFSNSELETFYSGDITDNGTNFAIGDIGHLFKFSNGNWFPLYDTIKYGDFNDIFFIDNQTGFVISSANKFLKTSDAGTTWNMYLIPFNGFYNSIYFLNSITGFAAGNNGMLLKTTNSGQNWTYLSTGSSINYKEILFINSNIGFIVGESGTIFRTTNSGTSWNSETFPNNPLLYCIYFTDTFTGFATGSTSGYGTIYKTTNSGLNWYSYSTAGATIFSIFFVNADTGFTCGWGGAIFKTTNSGNNWYLTNSNNNISLYSICFSSSQTGFAVGYDNNYLYSRRILRTTDGGENWYPIYIGSGTLRFNSIFFSNELTGYIAGSNGSIIKTTDGGGSIIYNGINNHGVALTESYLLSQNFPNPFNPHTKIKFKLPKKTNVKLAIYDLLGNEIVILVNKIMEIGSHEVFWNANMFSSGIYFYKLLTDEKSETRKMVLLK